MKRILSLAILVMLAACSDFSQEPVGPDIPAASLQETGLTVTPQIGPDDWIVVFRPGVADPPGLARAMVAGAGGDLRFTYQHTIRGFAANLPPQALQGIRNNPNVLRVEPDGIVTAVAVGSWGLDRIDQRNLPLNQTYTYENVGAGVDVYILDTGIRTTHNEFGSRAFRSADADFLNGDGNDCNGHGTHVAGTVGGFTYGVAKGVDLYAVRVLGCGGSGSISGVIAGVDWVTAQRNASGRPSVANMSLSAYDPNGTTTSLNDAVAASVDAGVVYAVAAANYNQDACRYIPASEPKALTVGATSSNDVRWSSSNYGTCLDLFAPGSGITSAYYWSDGATATLSGTSMASPHVAGVAALYLSANPTANPDAVMSHILVNATDNVVTNPGTGSPNKLLYSLITGGEPPDDIEATVSSISPITVRTQGKFLFGEVDVNVVEAENPSSPLSGVTVLGDWYREGDSGPFRSTTGVTGVDGLATLESGKVKAPRGSTALHFCVTDLSKFGVVYNPTEPACSEGFTPPGGGGPGDPGAPWGLKASWTRKGGGRVELRWTPGGGGEVDIFKWGEKIATKADDGRYNDRGGEPGDLYQICTAGADPQCTAEVPASG